MAEHLFRWYNNTLHVTGMPSRTIHIGEETYDYIRETKGEDQSFSSRARELLQQGVEEDKK